MCFNRHLLVNSSVIHHLCFNNVHIDHNAYVHLVKICQNQVALTELDILQCSITDEGLFTIFSALECHHSLQILRIHDNSASAHVTKAFLKLHTYSTPMHGSKYQELLG